MLQFVTAALEEKEPYKALKPHIDGLLLHVVLPMMAFNDDDAQLWEEDPAEFVRKVRMQRAVVLLMRAPPTPHQQRGLVLKPPPNPTTTSGL